MTLGLENAANARDLGGVPTAQGRVVRKGRLYRSNALHRLTDDDVVAIGRLRLACVIDFRHDREIEMIGADRLPPDPPGRIVSLPVFDPEDDIFTKVSLAASGKGGLDVLDRLREDHPSGGALAAMRQLYRWFVSASVARQTFAAALRLAAAAETLPLLFHCTAGKDRTGWLAALLLSALGVDRALIVEDYLRTNELNAASNAFILARAATRIPDTSLIVPLLDARAEYLEQSFDELDTVWGGIDAYLRTGLAIDDSTVADLRRNLLD